MCRGAAFLFLVLTVFVLAGRPFAADELKGQEVYDLHCAGCHGPGGLSTDPMVPSFADGDTLFLMDAELIQRISNGKDMMPAYRGLLTSEEMRDVVAYIRTF